MIPNGCLTKILCFRIFSVPITSFESLLYFLIPLDILVSLILFLEPFFFSYPLGFYCIPFFVLSLVKSLFLDFLYFLHTFYIKSRFFTKFYPFYAQPSPLLFFLLRYNIFCIIDVSLILLDLAL